ncbi:MAG TPA: hypothetical protein VMF66_10725 [Candidatus Acidoferrum sp.]|nr:hypothetical protein [Candidatus Acidoferrum sp.]
MRNASDDEILGIGAAPDSDARTGHGEFDWDAGPKEQTEQKKGAPETEQSKLETEKTGLDAILEANPELRQAWDDARAYRESFRTPQDARTATAALADLAKMDALFFSGRPQDHAELAKVVASLDPTAFQSLAKAMAEIAQREGTSNVATQSEKATTEPASRPADGSTQAQVSPAQEQFFQTANAGAVQAVIESIESQVERLLPEEISKGTRNRLVGEIYRELDVSLRADRQFADQAREAFRSGGFDEAHRRAIVSLVNSRARQALPAVARRVLNEWTSAIVAANQDRRARQRVAERRVDIGGSGRTGNDGVRPLTPRDINYSRMTDADILNM